MKKIYFIVLLLFAFIQKSLATSSLYIEDINVITSHKGSIKIREHVNVLVDKGRIIYIGKKSLNESQFESKINGNGKYLIPGLIDGHVHTSRMIGMLDKHFSDTLKLKLIKEYLRQEPKNYLYFGFTTLVDLGEYRPDLINKYYNNSWAPNVYGVGKTVRYFDGYGHNFFPKPETYTEYFSNWIYDNHQVEKIPKDIDLSEHSINAALNTVCKHNGIAVKTFYEDGFSGTIKNLDLPSDTLISHLVNSSHKRKLPVVLHATSVNGYKVAIKNNIDILAHGVWHYKNNDFTSHIPNEILDSLFSQIREKNIYVMPTNRVVMSEKNILDWDLINDTIVINLISTDLLKFFKSKEGMWGKYDLMEFYQTITGSDDIEHYINSMVSRMDKVMISMIKNKVPIILGTDTPTSDAGFACIPGLNGFMEMKMLYNSGYDLENIFMASTSRVAEAYRLNEIGQVEEGMIANLLVLDSNPLKSINAYNDLDYIINRGILIKRSDLKIN